MPILFLLVFLGLEILTFALVVELVGFWFAFLLLILGSATGFVMMRNMNVNMLQKLQKKMEKGELPLHDMMKMPFRMMASILLMIPGFLTDILAICCFIPATRNFLMQMMMKSKIMRGKAGQMNMGMGMQHFQQMHTHTELHKKHPESGNVLDGECWKDEDK